MTTMNEKTSFWGSTYGPHALLVGAVAMDFGVRKTTSSGTRFIDCFGYISASLTGAVSGWLIDNYSLNASFYLSVFEL